MPMRTKARGERRRSGLAVEEMRHLSGNYAGHEIRTGDPGSRNLAAERLEGRSRRDIGTNLPISFV